MILSASVLFLCAVVIVVSLVYLQRGDLYCKCSRGLQSQCVKIQDDCNQADPLLQNKELDRCNRCLEEDRLITERRNSACCQAGSSQSVLMCEPCEDDSGIKVVNIEDLTESTCLVNKADKRKRRRYTEPECQSTEVEAVFGDKSVEMDLSVDEYLQGKKHQLGRHVTMLLILLLMIIVGLFLALWCLLEEDAQSGIFIALRIADTFCVFGQIFVVFACFGFERQLIIIPFLARWRKLWYGVEVITLPELEDLDPDVVHLCDQFKRYHKQRCQGLIGSDKRYRLRKYKSVFRGDRLVDWLLEVGLAADRQAAVHYGNCLILGRVISHVTQAHFFYDSPYLYQFCSKSKSCQDDV